MNIQALYSWLANLVLLLIVVQRVSPAVWRWATAGPVRAALVTLLMVGPAFFFATLFVGPSMSLTVLAVASLLRVPLKISPISMCVVALLGAAFMCNALGVGEFDLYGIGYAPASGLLFGMAGLGLMGLVFAPPLAMLVGVAGLAFSVGLFDNLWDALLDPVLVIYCLVRGIRQLRERFNSARLHPARVQEEG